MVTLTCTAVSYPMPNVSRWELSSEDGVVLGDEELFTVTDIDFTVMITVMVPCVPESYRCVVGNSQGTSCTGITICVEGKHDLFYKNKLNYDIINNARNA